MITLEITQQEKVSRQLSPLHLKTAVDALREEGLVVLNNVVDTEHLDILNEWMVDDVKRLIASPDAQINWHPGNVQQEPPPYPPYLFKDVLLNDMVIAVTKAVLGAGVKNAFYSGNTAMPSERRQPVHADSGHLWPQLEYAHPAHALVVNIPTVDVSPENGSTEIWPGTHRDVTITSEHGIEVPLDVLEKRRAVSPPIQPNFKRGAALIRDMRMWHAGMPNRTDKPRPMIAMIHYPRWLETGNPLAFPKGTEDFFAGSELHTCAQFVEMDFDTLSITHP